MKMKRIDKIVFWWSIYAGVTVFLQTFGLTKEYNLGILIAILILPPFIHDILTLFFDYKKKNGN